MSDNREPETITVRYAFIEGDYDAARLGVDAETAGQELDRIRRRDHTLQPRAVLDESRPEAAPLHPVFEWNDAEAAERYRLHQAKDLIRCVRVVTPEREVPVARAVVMQPPAECIPAEDYDPLVGELDQVVGKLVESRRQLEELRAKAQRRFDRRKVMAADVALNELREAEELLGDAHETLTAGRKASVWEGEKARQASMVPIQRNIPA